MPEAPRALDGRLVLRAALVVVALPFLAAFVSLVATGDAGPRNHDVALIELRSRDVLGGDTPLVGSYERYGGNQPGPWMFWLLAIPSLAGPLGIGAATVLVGYGATAGMLWAARRRGGSVLVLWTALLAIVLALGRGFEQLTNPWEPMVTLLVVGLLVMLVWEVASGTLGAIPCAVAVTWFLASVWILLTPMAVCVGLVLAAAVVVRARAVVRSPDRRERRRLLRYLGISAGVLVLMALPTVVEQFTATVGNLTQLRGAGSSAVPTVGLAGAWRVLRLQFAPWAPWLGRALPLTLSSEVDGSRAFVVPVALVAWGASVVALLLVRRGGRGSVAEVDTDADVEVDAEVDAEVVRPDLLGGPGAPWWLHLGVAATLVGLLVGLSFSRGAVAVWSMEPTAALAMVIWLATGWTAAALVLRRRPEAWSERTAVVLAAVLVVVATIASVAALRSDQGPDRLPAAVARLATAVPATVPAKSGPLLVSSDAAVNELFDSGDFGVAELTASLERRGYRTVVAADLANKFGDRRARPGDATGELRIESGDAVPDGSGWTRVAARRPARPRRAPAARGARP